MVELTTELSFNGNRWRPLQRRGYMLTGVMFLFNGRKIFISSLRSLCKTVGDPCILTSRGPCSVSDEGEILIDGHFVFCGVAALYFLINGFSRKLGTANSKIALLFTGRVQVLTSIWTVSSPLKAHLVSAALTFSAPFRAEVKVFYSDDHKQRCCDKRMSRV